MLPIGDNYNRKEYQQLCSTSEFLPLLCVERVLSIR